MGDSYTAYMVPAKTAAAMTFICIKKKKSKPTDYLQYYLQKRQGNHT